EDGLDALEKMKENDVALIVSDWMMPRMDGIELCRKIRADQTTSHIPFILLTAKTDVDSRVEGLDCGADAYIEKRFSVQYLEACIKNLLDLRNLLRNKFSKMPMIPLTSVASNTMDNKFLTRINEIIEQNFSNPELSVDFLAEQLCISRSGLFAKIKTLADVTSNELIQIVRLKKAAALLMENQYRISEICYMVGFNSPSYFAKSFQKHFGIKPREFVSGGSVMIDPP
ncbi:response regulator, partial [Bacteroides heparinolyticus]|uniref:response regulator transcription factor n=1 Tax=Prevotella heparinolytica TaxID=28113 RepID=UPI00359FAB00